MLYAPALTPESRKHFQSFLPFLAVLLEERGRSRSGKLGWRLKRLQIHLSIRLCLSSPLIPITTTVRIYLRLSGWSSLYKIKRSIDQTRRELFCLKNVTMERMQLAQNLCYNTRKGRCTNLLSGLQVPKYSRWSLRQTNRVGGNSKRMYGRAWLTSECSSRYDNFGTVRQAIAWYIEVKLTIFNQFSCFLCLCRFVLRFVGNKDA